MVLPVMPYKPNQAGYNAFRGQGAVRVAFGGRGVYRRVFAPSDTVNVQWSLTSAEYGVFMVFVNQELEQGVLPFEVDLILDTPFPVKREAVISPGSLLLAGVSGDTYEVTATLRVK